MPRIALTEALLKTLRTTRAQEEFYDLASTGGGSFGVRVSRNGRKKFFMLFPSHLGRKRLTLGEYPLVSLKEARDSALRALRAGPRGASPLPRRFAELWDLFVLRALRQKSERTRSEYRRIARVELLPFLGERMLDDIREADIYHLLDRIAVERGHPVLAERVRSVLSGVFSFAVERRLIERSPIPRLPSREPSVRIETHLSEPQLRALLATLSTQPLRVRTLFLLLLLTGQRAQDVLGLRWQDLELDEWRMSRGVRLPLSRLACELLRRLREESRDSDGALESDYVFPGRGGGAQSQVRKLARRLQEKMLNGDPQAPWSRFTSREIRRTVEAGMRGVRVRPDVIEQALVRRTNLSRYARKRSEYDYGPELRSAFEAWGEKIASMMPVGSESPPSEPPPSAPSEKGTRSKEQSAKVVPLFPRPRPVR